MASSDTQKMPGGKMVEPPKGRRKAAAEMPGGAMHEPAPETPTRKLAAVKKPAAKKPAAKKPAAKKRGGTK